MHLICLTRRPDLRGGKSSLKVMPDEIWAPVVGPYWHQWGPDQPPDDPNGPILVNMTKMGPVGQYTALIGHDDRVQEELQISDEPQWPGRQSPHSRARPDPSSPCPACGTSLSVASPGGRKDTFICIFLSVFVSLFIFVSVFVLFFFYLYLFL